MEQQSMFSLLSFYQLYSDIAFDDNTPVATTKPEAGSG